MGKPDLSEFHELSQPKRPPCRVGVALDTLEPEEVEQLREALKVDQGIITNAAIAKWLEARGHRVHAATVTSHRKGNCRCDRG